MFNQWSELINYIVILMPSLLRGAFVTIQIFIFTLIFAIPLGLPITFGAMSRIRLIRWMAKVYIWIFRGTPLMLQLFFFYFYIPMATGITMTPFVTGVLTFVLNYAAYFAEIYRGGIESIDNGQIEASKALGFSRGQTMFLIILPQTVKRVLPAVTNETIVLVKDTALVSVITVAELLKNAMSAVNRDVNPTALIIVAIFYLFFTFLLTLLSDWLEKKYSN